MSDRGFRRWVGLGALASVVGLGAACEGKVGEDRLPERGREESQKIRTGGEFEGRANESQDLESFGEQREPATGGSGQQQGQPAQQPPPQGPQPASPRDTQQGQGGSGAPGFSTPQETGTTGTGVTGPDASQGGTSAPGTYTESGGIRPQASPPSDTPASDLGPGTPLGNEAEQERPRE